MKDYEDGAEASNLSPDLVPIRFQFIHPTAGRVAIAGSFNDWQPENNPLRTSGAGRWWNEIELAPGTYEYCLVVDGEWIPDPLAQETVPNPYGGKNSVITVPGASKSSNRDGGKNRSSRNPSRRRVARV